MNKTCNTCARQTRGCDPIRCIEGGALMDWQPRTFATPLDAINYMEIDLGYHGNCSIVRRPDGRYELEMEGTA